MENNSFKKAATLSRLQTVEEVYFSKLLCICVAEPRCVSQTLTQSIVPLRGTRIKGLHPFKSRYLWGLERRLPLEGAVTARSD